MNYFHKDKFYVFGERYVKISFEQYHNYVSRGVVFIANKKYKLETSPALEYNTNSIADYHVISNNLNIETRVSLIIVVYSVVNPDSYEYVRKEWNLSLLKFCHPNTPVILVGCNVDQRMKTEESTDQAKQEEAISEEMGLQLARRIKAAKFLECSGFDITDLKSINKNFVRVSARNRMRPMRIFVLGEKKSENTEMVKRLVQDERLNVLGERLNEELQYHNDNDQLKYRSHFSTLIEIDGEEHDTVIVDVKWFYDYQAKYFLVPALQENAGKWPDSFFDAVIVTFSVVDFDFCNVMIPNIIHSYLRPLNRFFKTPPHIILAGTKTDLRNDPKTINNLSKQGKQPITYEMGEQLSRAIGAVKYLECSSSGGIKEVFEETVWASLRRFEEERRTLIQKEKGFFRRIFERIFRFE